MKPLNRPVRTKPWKNTHNLHTTGTSLLHKCCTSSVFYNVCYQPFGRPYTACCRARPRSCYFRCQLNSSLGLAAAVNQMRKQESKMEARCYQSRGHGARRLCHVATAVGRAPCSAASCCSPAASVRWWLALAWPPPPPLLPVLPASLAELLPKRGAAPRGGACSGGACSSMRTNAPSASSVSA